MPLTFKINDKVLLVKDNITGNEVLLVDTGSRYKALKLSELQKYINDNNDLGDLSENYMWSGDQDNKPVALPTDVTQIFKMTMENYLALDERKNNTLYLIIENEE